MPSVLPVNLVLGMLGSLHRFWRCLLDDSARADALEAGVTLCLGRDLVDIVSSRFCATRRSDVGVGVFLPIMLMLKSNGSPIDAMYLDDNTLESMGNNRAVK